MSKPRLWSGSTIVRYPNFTGMIAQLDADGNAVLFTDFTSAVTTNQDRTIYFVRQILGYGDHFYTASATERDHAVADDGYHIEGIAFYVYGDQEGDSVPVWRLLNNDNGDHFYTASATERDHAVAYDGYHIEGIAFYVYGDQETDSVPVWRLLKSGQ
jgi:hypothetical protein